MSGVFRGGLSLFGGKQELKSDCVVKLSTVVTSGACASHSITSATAQETYKGPVKRVMGATTPTTRSRVHSICKQWNEPLTDCLFLVFFCPEGSELVYDLMFGPVFGSPRGQEYLDVCIA